MILLGARILNQTKVVATRRAGWRKGFELDAEHELAMASLTDDELAAALYRRQSLEPLRILPPQWDDDDFQLASRDQRSRFDDVYSFSRELNYTGSVLLWSQAPFLAYCAPIKARRSKRDQIFHRGILQ